LPYAPLCRPLGRLAAPLPVAAPQVADPVALERLGCELAAAGVGVLPARTRPDMLGGFSGHRRFLPVRCLLLHSETVASGLRLVESKVRIHSMLFFSGRWHA